MIEKATIEIRALGRYNNIRSFARKNKCKAISLKDLIGQTGVYNIETVINTLKDCFPTTKNIELLNGNDSYNYGWCWYKGWVAIEIT